MLSTCWTFHCIPYYFVSNEDISQLFACFCVQILCRLYYTLLLLKSKKLILESPTAEFILQVGYDLNGRVISLVKCQCTVNTHHKLAEQTECRPDSWTQYSLPYFRLNYTLQELWCYFLPSVLFVLINEKENSYHNIFWLFWYGKTSHNNIQ